MRIKQFVNLIFGLALLLSAAACTGQTTETSSPSATAVVPETATETAVTGENEADTVAANDTEDETVERPAHWTTETHSNDADPNYEVVFPEDSVNQITITIAPEDWEAMQTNMTQLLGEPGTGEQNGPGGGILPPDGTLPEGAEPPSGGPPSDGEGFPIEGRPPVGGPPAGGPPAGGFGDGNGRPDGQFGGGDLISENPMWVEATIEFNDQTWTNVGVRYKGNSSLANGWDSGDLKLPLKLDFDEFEDDYPEIDDQRFYGFKQLSLANGFSDNSFLRDAATANIMADAGLPVAETAFYEVIIDYGEGPVSLGLYTMIEVVDDTAVERVFGDNDGNIYEGDGRAASFAASTYDQIEESFQKENNKDEADWTDIEALYDVLHDDLRTSDPAAWRAELEALFNVDSFLEWLAISAVIEHWDAYGAMSHNYYLYHNPDTGQLEWISWDHNMAMSSARSGSNGPGGNGGPGGNTTLGRAEISGDWPLIRYLLDDPVYFDKYANYLEETINGPFNPDQMAESYRAMADLIEPYATADVGEMVFNQAIENLINHAYERTEAVEAYLASLSQAN